MAQLEPQCKDFFGAYSLLNGCTGFFQAAFTACQPVISTAIANAIPPERANIHQEIPTR
jgi:hypothetical protein